MTTEDSTVVLLTDALVREQRKVAELVSQLHDLSVRLDAAERSRG